MEDKTLNEDIMMVYPVIVPLTKRIKHFFSNITILINIILFVSIVGVNYRIYILNPDFIQISALISAPFLTLILLIIRNSHNTTNKKDKLLLAFSNELQRNWVNLKDNYETLNYELELIENNQISINPLFKVQFDVYNLMAQMFPDELLGLDLAKVEKYIRKSNEINELLRLRDIISQNKYVNYMNALKNHDEMIITRIKDDLTIIIQLLEGNGRIIKIDGIEEIKNLMNREYLTTFLKSNKLRKDILSEKSFESLYKRKISTLYILIIKSIEK